MFGFLTKKTAKNLLTINNARAKLRTKGNYTKERSFYMDDINATVSQTDTTDITSGATAQPVVADSTAPTQDAGVPEDLTDEEAIDIFIYGIMEEKGVAAGSDEIQATIFQDLKSKLLQELDRSLIAELPDDKIDELNNMAAEQGQIDPKIIANMVEEAGLNTAEIIGATMGRFRDIYLGDAPEPEDELESEDGLSSSDDSEVADIQTVEEAEQ